MRKQLSWLLFVSLFISNLALPGAIFAQKRGDKDKQEEKERRAEKERRKENKVSEESKSAAPEEAADEEDDDLPANLRGKIDKGEYLKMREDNINLWRGVPYPQPDVRSRAIYDSMRKETALKADGKNSLLAANWRYLGPSPIPNGSFPVSGRTTAIAVHPTNPDIAYVGTAQGGLYRTLNGGQTWTPLMDNALSLAIGAVAISPTDPTTIFVGTGEPNYSGDSFFGVGVYRITTADTNPVVAGPLRLDASGNDVFTGRAVSKIIVHPTDPNTMFVATTRGTCGSGGCTAQPAPATGLYRATNALAASPTFTKLTVQPANGGNRDVADIVIEPDSPNNMLAWVVGAVGAGDAGIYRSVNALATTPTFTQTYNGITSGTRGLLALQKTGSTVTAVAATGDIPAGVTQGAAFKSTDGGQTWATQLTAVNNFCNPQCFYDIAVAIDPTNANNIYIAGAPNTVFKRSLDGGTTFASSAGGLHVDSHAIAIAPSNPQIIYFGSDGGIYRSINGGTSWTSLNNSTFAATQFQSLALHPNDRNYTLGGTQDNGTQYFASTGLEWIYSDGGDGGNVVIDQNATTPTNVVAYHTYFNSSGSQIGFIRATTTIASGDPNWDTRFGCFSAVSNNGIACADTTLFYAPMVGGPGNPNTLYFGSNKLYRSADQGTTMPAVSQTFATTVSAISISPQNDNVRIVGLSNGQVWATTTGSSTLTQMTGAFPARFVGRVKIDPNNQNTAYATFNGYGVAAGAHVFKTTNLGDAVPTWTVAGNGIPDVPVNAFAVDPNNSSQLFAGTDIGVFRSIDAGANWSPINNGQLPRVAVFDMEIQKTFKVLKIATHGRGIWELDISNTPTRAKVADFDGDGKTDYSVFRPSNATWYALRIANSTTFISQFGLTSDVTVPADYDGDGKTDTAVFRNGTWYVQNSQNATVRVFQWGVSGDIPVAADYDGDGKADFGVFRNGIWYISRSSDSGATILSWGVSNDTPVVADYDGDGKSDVAVFRSGTWYVLKSGGGTIVTQWGITGDVTVPGDYDGDGKADLAVFRNGNWYVLQSGGAVKVLNWGLGTDIAAPGDYDGDGKTDFGVYRNGTWYVQSATSAVTVTSFGLSGDTPLPGRQTP